jgi:hypothetical protein
LYIIEQSYCGSYNDLKDLKTVKIKNFDSKEEAYNYIIERINFLKQEIRSWRKWENGFQWYKRIVDEKVSSTLSYIDYDYMADSNTHGYMGGYRLEFIENK